MVNKNEFYKDITSKVRKIRKERHLTQAQLSELIEAGDKYINDIEIGRIKPNVDRLKRIADVFGEDINHFIYTDYKNYESFITNFEKLNKSNQTLVIDLMKFLMEKQNKLNFPT